MSNSISISNEMSHFDYPSLSQDFEWKPNVEMALIYQVLTKQCLKKYFPHLMTLSQMALASSKAKKVHDQATLIVFEEPMVCLKEKWLSKRALEIKFIKYQNQNVLKEILNNFEFFFSLPQIQKIKVDQNHMNTFLYKSFRCLI